MKKGDEMNGNQENEPTAKEPATSAASVGSLEALENEAYNYFNVDHRPPGEQWLYMVLYVCRRIIDEGLAGKITDEVLERLESDNFHTAGHAAKIIRTLNKYNT